MAELKQAEETKDDANHDDTKPPGSGEGSDASEEEKTCKQLSLEDIPKQGKLILDAL